MYEVERDHTELRIVGCNGQELGSIKVEIEPWTQALLNAMFFYSSVFKNEFGELSVDLEESLYKSEVHDWLESDLGTDEDKDELWEEMQDWYGKTYESEDEDEAAISKEFSSIISRINFNGLEKDQWKWIADDLEKLWLDHYYGGEVGRRGNYKYEMAKFKSWDRNICGHFYKEIRNFIESVAHVLDSEIFWETRSENYEES